MKFLNERKRDKRQERERTEKCNNHNWGSKLHGEAFCDKYQGIE